MTMFPSPLFISPSISAPALSYVCCSEKVIGRGGSLQLSNHLVQYFLMYIANCTVFSVLFFHDVFLTSSPCDVQHDYDSSIIVVKQIIISHQASFTVLLPSHPAAEI